VSDTGNEVVLPAGYEDAMPVPEHDWKQACGLVKAQIAEIMHLPEKPPRNGDGEFMQLREKHAAVSKLVYKHLKAHGKFYNTGNVTTYVPDLTRETVQVVKGGDKFQMLMLMCGILAGDPLIKQVGLFLGSLAPKFPKATVYAGSFYDKERHRLYLNEWDGLFLRVNADGTVDRLRNGDDGMLFSDGADIQADPLHADIEAINENVKDTGGRDCQGRAGFLNEDFGLWVDGGSLVATELLDIINYDAQAGLGREHAHMLLTLAIAAMFLVERCPSYPLVEFYGPGGTMKSALAMRLGMLLVGSKFKVTLATEDAEQLKVMAMSVGYLVLDEANDQRKLQNALKAIATGAQDVRRELYTTVGKRVTPYQARIWLTVNNPTAMSETVASRKLVIKAGKRAEAEPYRSEFHLWKEFESKRDALWTELVHRLSGIMRALRQADESGQADLNVGHRMSSFVVLGLAVAKQEGWEAEFREAVEAMGKAQTDAVVEYDDVVSAILRLPASYNGTYRTADEWAGILSMGVPESNRTLRDKMANPFWLRYRLGNNSRTLEAVCGMTEDTILTKSKNRVKVYAFTGCCGEEFAKQRDGTTYGANKS
jgi:hypothetical protein